MVSLILDNSVHEMKKYLIRIRYHATLIKKQKKKKTFVVQGKDLCSYLFQGS